jgi:hypothetical protein
MGELFIHDLNPYLNEFKCVSFVETGTGKGTGIQYALQHPFKSLYSIEYISDLYEECKEKFTDSRLTLLNTDSLTGLESILEELGEGRCLFWLDAHFPGADFHFNSYDYLSDEPKLHKPLKYEVELIASKRPNSKDVFIIDDLQIYEDGPFELLNQEFKDKYGDLGIEFIEEAFGKTHDFSRDYRHQGFLILTPK